MAYRLQPVDVLRRIITASLRNESHRNRCNSSSDPLPALITPHHFCTQSVLKRSSLRGRQNPRGADAKPILDSLLYGAKTEILLFTSRRQVCRVLTPVLCPCSVYLPVLQRSKLRPTCRTFVHYMLASLPPWTASALCRRLLVRSSMPTHVWNIFHL